MAIFRLEDQSVFLAERVNVLDEKCNASPGRQHGRLWRKSPCVGVKNNNSTFDLLAASGRGCRVRPRACGPWGKHGAQDGESSCNVHRPVSSLKRSAGS